MNVLNKSVVAHVPITQLGWVFHGELIYSMKGADQKDHIAYYELAHLLDPHGNFDEASIFADFPLYYYEIRAMNIPVGVSNVRIKWDFRN